MSLEERLAGPTEREVAADRMTISEGGALIFWVGHEGQYADTISVAFAPREWLSVEALP